MDKPGELPRRQDFRVGWIAALQKEYLAAQQVLDVHYEDYEVSRHASDVNNYTFGRIGKHYVVIANLPTGLIGTHSASAVANSLTNTFPLIRFALMVGIAGGAPTEKNDVRLGDVIIGTRMVPYSFIRQRHDGRENIGDTIVFSHDLLSTTNAVQAKISEGTVELDNIITSRFNTTEAHIESSKRPDAGSDRLYQSDYIHAKSCDCLNAHSNYPDIQVQREERKFYEKIKVHYGPIGSADIVLIDANERDRLSEKFNLLGFEMESAGICLAKLPILPVRGICDYADSHKSKQWQGYAAAVAAVYARCLLQSVSSGELFEANNPVNAEDLKKEIELLVTTMTNMMSSRLEEQLQGHEFLEEHDKRYHNASQTMKEVREIIRMMWIVFENSTQVNSKTLNDLDRQTRDNTVAIQSAHLKIEEGKKQLQNILDMMQDHIQRQQEINSPEQRPKWEVLQAEAEKENNSLEEFTKKTEAALGSAVLAFDQPSTVTSDRHRTKIFQHKDSRTHLISFGTKKPPFTKGHVDRKREHHQTQISTGSSLKNSGKPQGDIRNLPPFPEFQEWKGGNQQKGSSCQPVTTIPASSLIPLQRAGNQKLQETNYRQSSTHVPASLPLPPRTKTVATSGPSVRLSQESSIISASVNNIGLASTTVPKLPPRPAKAVQVEVSTDLLHQSSNVREQLIAELPDNSIGRDKPSLPPRPRPAENQKSCSPVSSPDTPGVFRPVAGSNAKIRPIPPPKPQHLISFKPNTTKVTA
ncbi:hypothetical protein PENCOP_c018G09018 [Penicillium coprophilum]|uniref:Nucleoside phosphorylase domain-containing protein n=1 Tax=Penicillium coprophilum TaxID=36646 RepID=A0A1V6U7E0_9EURO|nr:hypothetical protein PENCOP_c018G09018 [Penicillium coprophilum]